jgi:low temperature requirement protein LtrA
MTAIGFSRDLLRPHDGAAAHRVTFVELFFDLVFVFAVTQISHHLIGLPTAVGLVQTVILTAAIWWVWVDTAWVTNWLNPERSWVRGLLIALMLGGLLMSSAIPEAFGDKGLLFAVSLVVIQLGRGTFTVLAFARRRRDNAINFVRITVWSAASGVFWIAGALVPPELRIWVWLLAAAIDFTGPVSRFAIPGLGATDTRTWDVTGEHMSERVSLFIIIALGESIVVTGSAFSSLPVDVLHLAAFVAAFASTVLMWLLYFTHAARRGSEFISGANDRGAVARAAYTYVPLVIVVGIVLAAVGDGLVLGHPTARGSMSTALLVTGSSAVYLLGTVLFARAVGGPWLVTHLAGIVVLAGLAIWSVLDATAVIGWAAPDALTLAWLVNGMLFLVVIVDELLFHRQRSGGAATSEV